MPSDYIDREAAYEAVAKTMLWNDVPLKRYDEFLSLIGDIPPADVKPVVHDRWEQAKFDDGYGPYYLYEHKNCGCIMARKRNYCPDCGSRMDGEPTC